MTILDFFGGGKKSNIIEIVRNKVKIFNYQITQWCKNPMACLDLRNL